MQPRFYRPGFKFALAINYNGEMLFDVNGVGDWAVFLTGIDITRQIWLAFDVSGVIASLEVAGKL